MRGLQAGRGVGTVWGRLGTNSGQEQVQKKLTQLHFTFGKFRFKRGDFLFGKLPPYFHMVGVAPPDGVCSTDIVVVFPVSNDWFGFLLGHVTSRIFVEYADAGSTGTRMPRTN